MQYCRDWTQKFCDEQKYMHLKKQFRFSQTFKYTHIIKTENIQINFIITKFSYQ